MADKTPPPNVPRPKELPFYNSELENLAEPARKLLENYSGIAPADVVPHIKKVRDLAWEIFPYPCIGMFRFLDMSLIKSSHYPEVLERLKNGQKLLDLGCCFGQEIRQLASDGVPSENLYGSDLRKEFWDLGYDLFLDKDKLKAKFIAGNIFDPESPLKQLDGQIDIVQTGSFFHLFDLETQEKVAKRVVKLLKPQPGSIVIGRQVGSITPGLVTHSDPGRGSMYRHNIATWKEMWRRVSKETDVAFEVEAELQELNQKFFGGKKLAQEGWNSPGTCRLWFTVRRI